MKEMRLKDYLYQKYGMYSIQTFPVEELLALRGHTSCHKLLEAVEDHDLYAALAFVFSIYLLIQNIPEELPDNIPGYVKEKINEWQLPYEFNNKKLEKGLWEYFAYTLPRRKNEDRDIVYSRIREAGYSYLRFAQEICKQFAGSSCEDWQKVVERVKLADAYGDVEEIEEIRNFFSKLTQNNFEESFVEKGYPATFAKHLKWRLAKAEGSGKRSAWNLLETGVEIECRENQLYFVMPEKGFFNSELKNIAFTFRIKDLPPKYCCYRKKDFEYRRYHMDSNIPASQCQAILRDGSNENAMPEFLKEPIIIWDVEKKCHKKLESTIGLVAGREYILFATLSFQSGQDSVRLYEEDTYEEISLPFSLSGDKKQVIVISVGGARISNYFFWSRFPS